MMVFSLKDLIVPKSVMPRAFFEYTLKQGETRKVHIECRTVLFQELGWKLRSLEAQTATYEM